MNQIKYQLYEITFQTVVYITIVFTTLKCLQGEKNIVLKVIHSSFGSISEVKTK